MLKVLVYNHSYSILLLFMLCLSAVQEALSVRRASVFAVLRSRTRGNFLSVGLLDIVEWAPSSHVYLGNRKALRILLFLTDPKQRRKGWGRYCIACIKVSVGIGLTSIP